LIAKKKDRFSSLPKDFPYKSLREALRKALEIKDGNGIVEAAKELFVKTFNPAYYYLMLEHSDANKCPSYFSYYFNGCDIKALSHYLYASMFIYHNTLTEAQRELTAAIQSSEFGDEMPLYVLKVKDNRIVFIPQILKIHEASKKGLIILNKILQSKSKYHLEVEGLSYENLIQFEKHFHEYDLYPGYRLSEFSTLRAEALKSGLVKNTFWLISDSNDPKSVPITFANQASSEKSMLLLLMAVRENSGGNDDDIFFAPNDNIALFEKAWRGIGEIFQENDIRTSKKWYGGKGWGIRRIYVYRINEKFENNNIRDPIIIQHHSGKYSYMIASDIKAEIIDR
jgi:hypothetical protein